MPGELMALAKQRLDVLLRKVDVMGGNLDEKRLLLLRFEHAVDVGSVQGSQGLPGHHALLIRGHDQHLYLRIRGGQATDLLRPARVAIAFRIHFDAEDIESLKRQCADLCTTLPNATGKEDRIHAAHPGDIRTDVFAYAVAVGLER